MKLEQKLARLLISKSPYTDILVRTDNMVSVREPMGWSTQPIDVDAVTIECFACEVLKIKEPADDFSKDHSHKLQMRLMEMGAQNESINVYVQDEDAPLVEGKRAPLTQVRMRVDISLASRTNDHSVDFTAGEVGMIVDELVVELVIRRHRDVMPLNRLFQKGTVAGIQRELNKDTGLILVTGKMGSGKTSTCASMIEALNQNVPCHILTIEDPIEYRFKAKEAVISQREVRGPGMTFVTLARNALRQNPNVVFISELRDAETTAQALLLAQSTLVITTTHANKLDEAIERIVNFFPGEAEARQTLRTLRSVLLMVLTQALLPSRAGGQQMFYELVLSNNKALQQALEDQGDLPFLRSHLDDLGLAKIYEFLKLPNNNKRPPNPEQFQTGIVPMNPLLAMAVVRGTIEPDFALRVSPNRANFEKLLGPMTEAYNQAAKKDASGAPIPVVANGQPPEIVAA